MPALVDFLLELGRRMEDPQELEDEMRARLDPALVDRLSAFSAARRAPFSQVVLWAVECFTLSAAEEAWRKLADDASSEPVFDAAALNVVLERFLSVSLDLSHQGRIEGPPGPPDHHAFRRVA
jgi:uncharacterized membrane protein